MILDLVSASTKFCCMRRPGTGPKCITTSCMAWRDAPNPVAGSPAKFGYCGLAGTPTAITSYLMRESIGASMLASAPAGGES